MGQDTNQDLLERKQLHENELVLKKKQLLDLLEGYDIETKIELLGGCLEELYDELSVIVGMTKEELKRLNKLAKKIKPMISDAVEFETIH